MDFESIVQIVNKVRNLAQLSFNMCRFISEGVPRDPGAWKILFWGKIQNGGICINKKLGKNQLHQI